jgi:hypothetical protein
MRDYTEIKEEIIETSYYITNLINKDKPQIIKRLQIKLNRLIDEALEVKKNEKKVV